MATKVKALELVLPAGQSLGDTGPLNSIACYAHHACIAASGDFASGALEVETSYDGEFWSTTSTIAGPGTYPMGEPSVWARVKVTTPPTAPSVMSVRLVMGGAVEDGCCDPCNDC